MKIENEPKPQYINHNDYIDIQSHPIVPENNYKEKENDDAGGKTPITALI